MAKDVISFDDQNVILPLSHKDTKKIAFETTSWDEVKINEDVLEKLLTGH